MRLNIGVMELHCHPEAIYSVASLAKYCNTDVTIFTTKLQHEKALPFFKGNQDDYVWVLQQDGETLLSFLKRIERHCSNRIDLLFVNTFYVLPHRQIYYYFFRPQCKTVHMVGRVECLFGKWKPIDISSLRSFIFSIAYNISQIIRKRTLPMFDGIWVENRDAYNYAISAGYKKKIACLSFHHSSSKPQFHEYNGKIKFITIGSVTSVRRDYKGLLDAFEKLFDLGRKNITLTLLGAPVDRDGFKIIDRCRELIDKGLDIHYYTKYVPEDVLNQKILSADIIVNPNDVNQYDTGTFGAIVKAMQFAKPGIYPINSLRYEELISSSLFYNSIKELPGMIEDLLSNPDKIKELSRKAGVNSEKFSFKTIANKFKESVLNRHLLNSKIL